MSSLKRTIEVIEHRSGGDPSTTHTSSGPTKYEAVTLERGLIQEKGFYDSAGLVWNFDAGLGLDFSLARRLLQQCSLDAAKSVWSEQEIEAVGELMAAADRVSEILLSINCAGCGVGCEISLDLPPFL